MWDWPRLNCWPEMFYSSPYKWCIEISCLCFHCFSWFLLYFNSAMLSYRFSCPGVTWCQVSCWRAQWWWITLCRVLMLNLWVTTPMGSVWETCLRTVIIFEIPFGDASGAEKAAIMPGYSKGSEPVVKWHGNTSSKIRCSSSYSPWSAAAVWCLAGRVVGHQRPVCCSHIVVRLVWDSDWRWRARFLSASSLTPLSGSPAGSPSYWCLETEVHADSAGPHWAPHAPPGFSDRIQTEMSHKSP